MIAPLICIVGESGVGKTTLVKFLLKRLSHVRYLQYLTTRQPRSLKERFFSFEYSFCTDKKYQKLKKESENWEELQAGGFLYGVDVNQIEYHREMGTSYVSTMLAQKSSLESRLLIYQQPIKFIYLKASEDMLKQRVLSNARISRKFDSYESMQNLFDLTLVQTGNLSKDLLANFSEILYL